MGITISTSTHITHTIRVADTYMSHVSLALALLVSPSDFACSGDAVLGEVAVMRERRQSFTFNFTPCFKAFIIQLFALR